MRLRLGVRSYVCLWEFRVNAGFVSEFEKAYGPGGDWARLFRRADGYLGTELLRDRDDPYRYVTADYWQSRASYDAFQTGFGAEYAAVDARCAAYSVEER